MIIPSARARIEVRLSAATDLELESIDAMIEKHLSRVRYGDPIVLIGSALTDARKAKGWSQGKLARLIGCSQSTVCRWESDHVKPEGKHLEAMIDLGFERTA